ncbi:pyridoxamine 5'-phosphate oxidase family protein [Devosia rhizoryzae]|uniref:Pyridoxamine 5'-phosphate oxidase family protein n=1 Tax=Devosia rhizoryzae TaxID=2774137 RepID=A0ABX7C717_9HYPH|nr:pyridoxamine 5'-phosphate oxidase family protein [Devosia rhizoryzae]QQR39906.1 pyridoxamine 5'-phosphate oxidase family protein [Devosia rhizoryzae]
MVKEHHDNDKSPAEIQDRIWELAKKIDFCMFTTWDGERQRSRPLSARPERENHAIYFLVDAEGEKNWQVDKFPWVSCAWADNSNFNYVVISGNAKVTNDRAKIKDLWTDFDKAWWDDENDPSIRLLTVTPEDAELWDSPGKIVSFAKMAVAAVTGKGPEMGTNEKVNL